MLLNRDRAYAVMDRHGLDGLLAVQKINFYYLTDYLPNAMKVERFFTNFALLPRREDAPAGMTMGLSENGRHANKGSWMPNVLAITGRVSPTAANVGAAVPKDIEEDPARRFIFGAEDRLTEHEWRWAEAIRGRASRMVPTATDALKRLFTDAGLTKGRIGTDDPRVIDWLHSMGLTGITGVDATNIFREIRMVKSPDEVALLRKAATANEEAVETTIKAIHEGATNEELERVYMTDIARHGGQGIFILFGYISGLRHGRFVKGEPVMIDALGTYGLYNGDLGRTVVLGEPDVETARRMRAVHKGWDAAVELMKPGVRGSDIVRRVVEVVQREGFPSFNHCVAHTVGLEHTDHPLAVGPDGLGGQADFVVEPGMVLNFDMPHIEWGWGSMHIEDTMLITKMGFEPLTSMRTEMRVL
jgi:Xaa-Pro dipeptidase